MKASLLLFITMTFCFSTFAQTTTGRFGLKYSFVSSNILQNGIDNEPNHRLRVENIGTTQKLNVMVTYTGTNDDGSVPSLSGGGFAVFPNGGSVNLRVGDTTVVQGWSSGWRECSCINPGSNNKKVRFIFSYDSAYYGSGGQQLGTVTLRDTLFQSITIIERSPTEVQQISAIQANTRQEIRGSIVIPEYIKTVTTLSTVSIATDGYHWPIYPPTTATAGYVSVVDSLNNKYVNFRISVTPRSDYRIEAAFTTSTAGLLVPPVTVVVPDSTSHTSLFATALPYGKAIFSIDSVKTYETQTGFWRTIFSSGDSSVTVFPGQENWYGSTTADRNIYRARSRIMKFKVDNTNYSNLVWEYALPTESWGGAASRDGRYVVYMINQGGQESGLQNDPNVDWVGVLDGATGTKKWGLRGEMQTQEGLEVGISGTGDYIALGTTGSGRLTLYRNNGTSGTKLWSNPPDFSGGNSNIGQVRKIAFSADDQYVYAGSGDMYLRKYRVSNGEFIWKAYIGGWPFVNGLAIANGYIITGTKSKDRTVVRDSDGSVVYLSGTVGFDASVDSAFTGPVFGFGPLLTDATNGRTIARVGSNAVKHSILNGSFALMADRNLDVYSRYGGPPLANKTTYMGTGGGEQSQSGWATGTGDRLMLAARDMVSGTFPRKGVGFYRTSRQINRYPTMDSIRSKSFTKGDSLRFKVNYRDYGDYNTLNTQLTLEATPDTAGLKAIVRGDSIIVYAESSFAGTAKILVAASESGTQDKYKVSERVTVTATCTSPATPTASSTNVSYCKGDAATALTATPPTGATLVWYTTATGGTGSATAPTPSTTAAGTTTYYVSSLKNGCESAQRLAITVTVNDPPAKPTITRDANGNLVSSATAGNQWYKEGVAISGATAASYKPAEAGNYTLKVTQNGCTSPASEAYYYLVTAVINFNNGQFIKMYPNPVRGDIRVDYRINGQFQLKLMIFDISGKQVFSKDKISSGSSLSLNNLTRGSYLVRIYEKSGKLIYTDKIIKE